MKLYFHPLSGHVHRARLFLSLLGLEHELVLVDLLKGEHKSPAFLRLNSFGQLPVLDDNGTVVPDSNAILVYLAKRYAGPAWLPEEPAAAAGVQRWLSVAAGEIAYGPAAARVVNLFGRQADIAELVARAHRILALIDAELTGQPWIAGAAPTIADVALYSYIARAPEGDVDLAAYVNVNAWLARVEALPGFVPMAVSPVGLAA
ncbi:glutathione S-transferase family protein [Pseudoduganella namucuonensis]|uniref:Glutathione S-transferase n=1 Tax=Pseudoduganella namucuonensis TaxID=1035707 RepID=A0A1I7JFS5_9BURK|nr:glutathione S-transferase [Pseudoduganella namucuonensis]SFU84038.1 glutathione S-transferase [Pseudoduganella namucuonensis]